MKFKTVKTLAMAFSLITGVSFSLAAEAIQVSGMLGTSLVAVDGYTFTCPSGTVQVRARVFDLNTILNSAATVYATFGKDGNPTLTVFDTESTSTSSPWATNTADGLGNYALVVRKSASNPEDYIIEAQCLDSSLVTIIGPPKLILQINQ
jgi:hypothetical protein